ncbi:hypothetical protein HCN44_005770 [Aphidius gifuensis]|uniref:Nondiscriminating glutamyl-tRNA synthetase EARS2, mitochondrial n=1 Tax=Aphidius gifuensis TaxID=684658 RepID=A0A835CRM2_APHGI|nr:probable glutamate--tRNA ligase, mitochondrial [Aphidius gifuensis]KAF7992989.1 hypothetical protein HCN44_005770 [Aphidius gifuensis]
MIVKSFILNIRLIQRRYYSRQQVRVRFAPSPTGNLHLGGLRTALYNYLFARKNNGSFILRIEDTDQTRLQSGAMEQLQDDMVWAGIIPDESPVRGGPSGPYIQSKRLDIYKKQVETLLNNGSAYYCFCTERRLELLKKEAQKTRQISKYDNHCRHHDKETINEKLNNGQSYCIRFKLGDKPPSFNDLVYGNLSISQVEGDPVIIKSDGFPTYHFANVVDDHLMNITHVLRGVEWQISTPKHIEIYNAFGWTPPHYAHLPLILNSDGSKLSKRQGDITVNSFRNTGIFPLALLNYITYAGGGFDRNPNQQNIYTYQELIQQFNINRINPNSCKLQPDKLPEFNRYEITRLLSDKNNSNYLIHKVKKIVNDAFVDRKNDGSLQLDDEHIMTILDWSTNRIHNLNDLVSKDLAFLWVIPTDVTSINDPNIIKSIKLLSQQLNDIDKSNFDKKTLTNYLKLFTQNNDIKFSNFMKLLRSILSGLDQGPAVAEMMEILGKDKTLERLNRLFNC